MLMTYAKPFPHYFLTEKHPRRSVVHRNQVAGHIMRPVPGGYMHPFSFSGIEMLHRGRP